MMNSGTGFNCERIRNAPTKTFPAGQPEHTMEQADYDLIIANSLDPDARENMPLRYGVAVERTLLLTFPYDGMILDDPNDLECDYQSLVGIRMNEPVALHTASARIRKCLIPVLCGTF